MGLSVLLIVLIVAGFAFVFYALTIGRAKHGEEIAQAEEDLAQLSNETREQKNITDLISHLSFYNLDRTEILEMYYGNELPPFIYSEWEAHDLADELLGTTFEEERVRASHD